MNYLEYHLVLNEDSTVLKLATVPSTGCIAMSL